MQSSSQIAAALGPIFKGNPSGNAYELYVSHRPDGSSSLYQPWLISLVDLYPVLESNVIAYRDPDGHYHQVNSKFPIAGEPEFTQARIHPFEPSHYKSMFIEGKMVPEIYAKAFEDEDRSVRHTAGIDITYLGLNGLDQEIEFNLMRMCLALSEGDDCMAFLANRIAKFGEESVLDALSRETKVSGEGLWIDSTFGKPRFTQIAPEVLKGFTGLNEQDYAALNLYQTSALKPVCMISPFHDLKLYRYKDEAFRQSNEYRAEFDYSRVTPEKYKSNLMSHYLKQLSSKLAQNLSAQSQSRSTQVFSGDAGKVATSTTSNISSPNVKMNENRSKSSLLSRLASAKEVKAAATSEAMRPQEGSEAAREDLARIDMIDNESEVNLSEIGLDTESSFTGEPPEYITEAVPTISDLRAQKKSFSDLASQAGLVTKTTVDTVRSSPRAQPAARGPGSPYRRPVTVANEANTDGVVSSRGPVVAARGIVSARVDSNRPAPTSTGSIVKEVTKPSFAMRGEQRSPVRARVDGAAARPIAGSQVESRQQDSTKPKGRLFEKLSASQTLNTEDDEDSIPTAINPALNSSLSRSSISKKDPGF